MSMFGTLKSLVGLDDSEIRIALYKCRECGNVFESSKSIDRVHCMECLSDDVVPFDADED